MRATRRRVPSVRGDGFGRPPELDDAAAEALAVVTLLTVGDERDTERAGYLIEELLGAPGGPLRLVNGLSSVCATLLVLLEFRGALSPPEALREVGRLIAQASIPV
jgi:hypothetical protein